MDKDVSKLFELVQQGDLEGLKKLVDDTEVKKRKGDSLLNSVDERGYSVLCCASQEGHPAVVKWILSEGGGRGAGFDMVLAKTNEEKTALHLAAVNGHLECCQALVDGSLIENGERDELLNAVASQGRTFLHHAAECNHPSIIKWLLSSSEGGRAAGFTNILARTINGMTSLHLAAYQGNLECCQALVDGSNVDNGERAELLNTVDNGEWTALHYAARDGHLAVIRWLLSNEEGGGRAAGFEMVLAKTSNGSTALLLAAANGRLECCQALVEGTMVESGERAELLNGMSDKGWTALHFSAFPAHPSVVEWLLSSEEGGGRAAGFTSPSITARISDSSSALHLVVESGTGEALNALLSGCTPAERLTLFLSVDEHGWTPLHAATRYCQRDIIHELLLHHPETQTIVDARDHRGLTALHRAVIGGIDEESKDEWIYCIYATPVEAVMIEALLTVPENGNEDKNQQAAMIDPNLGIKIE